MSTGFTFGAKPPTTQTTSFFSTETPTLGFGTSLANTTQPPAFGAPTFKPTATSGPLGLGTLAPAASTAAPGFSFGATTTSTAAQPSGLSFGLTPTVSSAAPATGLNFGGAAPSTGGLTFGSITTTSTAAPTFGLGTSLGGFGVTSSSAPQSMGFGLGGGSGLPASTGGFTLTTPATQAPSLGLGGVVSLQSKLGAAAATPKEVPPKEQFLPNEFSVLVDQFKQFVQDEKTRSSEVARSSMKEFCKVEADLDLLGQQFGVVENQLQVNRNLAEQLKYDSAKGLQTIEMAHRTQDTPASLQYDNTAPLHYFIELADHFEKEMQMLKVKIDNTEKFVRKNNEANVLTSQDLTLGMRRLHDTFVALAGRMQAVHSQVEVQKEAFLAMKKKVLKDGRNPFEQLGGKSNDVFNEMMRNPVKLTPGNLASGPTPFNTIAIGSNSLNLASQQQQGGVGFSVPAPQNPIGSNIGGMSFMSALNKPAGAGTNSFFSQPNSFDLQKPPTGNKRGKM